MFILHTVNSRANRIGHMLCRNCRLKQVIDGKIEGRIEVTGRRGRRCKKLLDDLKEKKQDTGDRGSTRSYSVDTSLPKRLVACYTGVLISP